VQLLDAGKERSLDIHNFKLSIRLNFDFATSISDILI